MIQIPASLIERIKTRQTVLVTGMGCCELAGLPGWGDLTETLLKWLQPEDVRENVQALFNLGRQAAAVAYLRARLPEETIARVITDAYSRPVDPPRSFQVMATIPWRGVVTCTFDDLWDRALADDESNPTKVFLPAEAAALKEHRGRFLLHIFGCTVAPDTLCLSPADVRRKVTPTGVGDFLDEVYRKRSFVFVGFRPGDSDLTMLAERLLGANVNEAEHFLLYPGALNMEAELIQAEFGLTPVPFDGGLDEAFEALGQAWASVAAESRPAEDDIEAWLEILGRDPSDDEARRVLDRADARLRHERNWSRLIDLLLGRFALLSDSDTAARVAALREVARIYDRELNSPAEAYEVIGTAFRSDPSDPELLVELKGIVGRANAWASFLGEYTELVKAVTDPKEQVRHWLEIGRIYAEELNNLDYAIASFQHVLSIDAQCTAAFEPLGDLLARRERWAELAQVLQAHAAAETQRERKGEILAQLGEVYSAHLGDADTAIAAYERVLNLNPRSEAALGALERLYRKAERWKDLAGVLESHAEVASDPAEASRLKKEAASLLADRVGDVDASIRSLEAVLANDPNNRQALHSLESLYDKAGRQNEYLRTLERLVDLADNDGERVTTLRRLAAEWESRPDGQDRAAEALEQLLQIDANDENASRSLMRIYRGAKRWHALAEALTRQIEAANTPVAKRELYRTLGKLYQEDLGDNARAIEAYVAAERLGDDREETLSALAALYEQQESWRLCVEALDRLTQAVKDPAARTAAAFRAGTIMAERLDDKRGAEERLAKALENDEGHIPSLSALARLYRANGEYLRAAKLMLETEERTQNRIEKTRLLYEAGVLYQDQLNDDDRALELFRRALEIDPEHVEAGWRLAELLEQREIWAAAEPLLDMLVRKVDRADAEYAASVHCRLAVAAKRLGNTDKAMRAYEAAYEIAPGSLEVLIGYAGMLIEAKDWAKARDLLRNVLKLHQAALSKPQVVDIFCRLGQTEAERGDLDAAIAWYEKAFSMDGKNAGVVAAIADLHQRKGDWSAAAMDKRTLSGLVDAEQKAKLAEEMGDIYAEHLNNPAQAITHYQTALEAQPSSRGLMHKLLDLYTSQKRWQPAIDLLSRLADAETEPQFRAKFLYTAAVVARDEMHDGHRAVEMFNKALDYAPENTKAFDAIERVLADAQDWKELARNYRKMIKRLAADAPTELKQRLWGGLADVALEHLQDAEMATTALEVVTQLDRNALERHEQLADLYMQAGPDALDKAIAEHQILVQKNPDRLGSYRALARLYQESGARDKLYCLAATLTFLKKADTELKSVYERYKPQGFVSAKRKFNDDLFAKVVHPDEDRLVTLVFSAVGHFMAATSAQQHQAYNLRRQARADLLKDERMPGRALRYACETLNLAAPDLFYNPDEPVGLSVYNLQERGMMTPAFVVGQGLMQRTNEREVIFEIGRRVAFLRTERFVRYAMLTPAALEIGLRAALMLGGAAPTEQNTEVDKLANALQRLVPKPIIDQLAVVSKKLINARGDEIDIQGWIAAADLTAARTGFVLANDLAAAARVISGESGAGSPLSQKQKLRDLLAFSVSEEYFAVRKMLGIEAA